MQIGMIGLGRMGANMVRRLLRGGHECVVFDMSPKAVDELVQEKAWAPWTARPGEEAGCTPRDLADGPGGGGG
jgi:6-phosphogluconate dehydrogenase (decarboxylating)